MDTSGKHEHIFDEVHIAKGARPVARHGWVTVTDGMVTLLGTDRHLIARAPVEQVQAAKVRLTGGMTLKLRINGTRYNVSPKWGERSGPIMRPGPGDPARAERATDELLHVLETS